MTTKFGGKQCRGLTTGIPERSPAPLHYAVVRPGEKELEALRIRLEGKGEVLPVFSAAWASRGYLFAVACTRKVSIRVGTVCGSCKHWRRERRHYRHVRG